MTESTPLGPDEVRLYYTCPDTGRVAVTKPIPFRIAGVLTLVVERCSRCGGNHHFDTLTEETKLQGRIR